MHGRNTGLCTWPAFIDFISKIMECNGWPNLVSVCIFKSTRLGEKNLLVLFLSGQLFDVMTQINSIDPSFVTLSEMINEKFIFQKGE